MLDHLDLYIFLFLCNVLGYFISKNDKYNFLFYLFIYFLRHINNVKVLPLYTIIPQNSAYTVNTTVLTKYFPVFRLV